MSSEALGRIVTTETTDERLNDLSDEANDILFELTLLLLGESIVLSGSVQTVEIFGTVRGNERSGGSTLNVSHFLSTFLQNCTVGTIRLQSAEYLLSLSEKWLGQAAVRTDFRAPAIFAAAAAAATTAWTTIVVRTAETTWTCIGRCDNGAYLQSKQDVTGTDGQKTATYEHGENEKLSHVFLCLCLSMQCVVALFI